MRGRQTEVQQTSGISDGGGTRMQARRRDTRRAFSPGRADLCDGYCVLLRSTLRSHRSDSSSCPRRSWDPRTTHKTFIFFFFFFLWRINRDLGKNEASSTCRRKPPVGRRRKDTEVAGPGEERAGTGHGRRTKRERREEACPSRRELGACAAGEPGPGTPVVALRAISRCSPRPPVKKFPP